MRISDPLPREQVGFNRSCGTLELELRFGEFGWGAVLAAAGTPRAAGDLVAEACTAYERRRDDPALSLKPPAFGIEQGTARTVDVPASSELWASLLTEAARRETTLERLVEHAVVLYLANGPAPRRRW